MRNDIASLNIVLMEPEIPQNTGNIGRTCVALGASLHLVGRLGFSIDHKDLKRAGMDYWEKLKLVHHNDWNDFLRSLKKAADLVFFSTKGERSLWNHKFQVPVYLVFGSESRGFPPSFYERYKKQLIRIPMASEARSLNLATAVGVVAYEAAKQGHFLQLKSSPSLPQGSGNIGI